MRVVGFASVALAVALAVAVVEFVAMKSCFSQA